MIHLRAYMCGARVVAKNEPPARNHVLLLVTPVDTEETTYLVDVGFGSNVPVRPIQLKDGETVKGASFPEQHRVVQAVLPNSAVDWENAGLPPSWTLERRWNGDQPWETMYHFTLEEVFPQDTEDMSLAVSMRQAGIFWPNVIAVAHFEEGDEIGRLVLEQNVVRNLKER